MNQEKVKKTVDKHDGSEAMNSSPCCISTCPPQSSNQKTLTIEWQRLISNDKTCPRCSSTEGELDTAVSTLKQALAPLGIEVVVEKRELSVAEFKKAPLQSNRIWMNNRPLEEYIGGSVGQSPCCDVCGPAECRTVSLEGHVYETIPSKIIIQAGLVAAAQLMNSGIMKLCCSGE